MKYIITIILSLVLGVSVTYAASVVIQKSYDFKAQIQLSDRQDVKIFRYDDKDTGAHCFLASTNGDTYQNTASITLSCVK